MMAAEDKLLSGRVAVVTGSSSGIGRAIALELARQGAAVVVHGRKLSEGLVQTHNQIESFGHEALMIALDLEDESQLVQLVDSAWKWKNRVDIWINNAGADVLTGEAAKLSFTEKFDRIWKVDVRATLILSRLVGIRMYSEPGASNGARSILNMGWDQAWQGMEGDSGELFATTKGAIMSMTKSLAQSFCPQVRVNCLAPGWIKTKWGESASNEWERRAIAESLMSRWGTPEDVAQAAMFLSSDLAKFISGQILPVNGGFRYAR